MIPHGGCYIGERAVTQSVFERQSSKVTCRAALLAEKRFSLTRRRQHQRLLHVAISRQVPKVEEYVVQFQGTQSGPRNVFRRHCAPHQGLVIPHLLDEKDWAVKPFPALHRW